MNLSQAKQHSWLGVEKETVLLLNLNYSHSSDFTFLQYIKSRLRILVKWFWEDFDN